MDPGIQFSYTWVDAKEKYFGGLGENGDIPVLFFVNLDDHDATMASMKSAEKSSIKSNSSKAFSSSSSLASSSRVGSATAAAAAKGDLLSDPANLLRGIINNQSDRENAIEQLSTPSAVHQQAGRKQQPSASTPDIIATPSSAATAAKQKQKDKPKKTLIQDLSTPRPDEATVPDGVDVDVGAAATTTTSFNRSKQPAIKKGFLTGANSGIV